MDHVSLKLIRLAFSFSLNRNKWTRKKSRDLFSRWTLQKQKKNYSASESMNVQYRLVRYSVTIVMQPLFVGERNKREEAFPFISHRSRVAPSCPSHDRSANNSPPSARLSISIYLSIYLFIQKDTAENRVDISIRASSIYQYPSSSSTLSLSSSSSSIQKRSGKKERQINRLYCVQIVATLLRGQ